MSTALCYFSATGNTLVVARDLATALGDATVIPIKRAVASPVDLAGFDRVGIIYPVFVWGAPMIVQRFMRGLKGRLQGKYVFLVATYGGTLFGALDEGARVLRQSGVDAAAGFAIRMPTNYTPIFQIPSEKARARQFAREKARISAIAAAVKAKQTSKIERWWPAVNWLFSLQSRIMLPRMREADHQFTAHARCNGCGICQRVCPVGNVTLVQSRPRWSHHCELCLACLHWCPLQCINWGRGTVKHQRYHHPEVRLNDVVQG
jgi:ferredoxin